MLAGAYAAGFYNARRMGRSCPLHSRPPYHGVLQALQAAGYVAGAGIGLWLGGFWFYLMCVAAGVVALIISVLRMRAGLMARVHVERAVRWLMVLMAGVSILTTAGVVLSLVFETIRFFAEVSFIEFLFGTQWSPQTALRADQVAADGLFGSVPPFGGSFADYRGSTTSGSALRSVLCNLYV